jgi:mitogen-activated protein kinase 15
MLNEEDIDEEILAKYRPLVELGKGAYGIVWKAEERLTKNTVALKKILGAFNNDVDAQRTYREVYILQSINHKNIVKLLNVHRARNEFDLYLIFEYMHTDLYHVIYEGGILNDDHKVFVCFQLFSTLLYLESLRVVHRDLKPANILIDSNCTMKLADFGLARTVEQVQHVFGPIMTENVATKLYRAPEVMLGSKHYSFPVDMWSAGCIIAEMFMDKPVVLMQSQNVVEQLQRFFNIFGKPSDEDLESIQISRSYEILKHINPTEKLPLHKVVGRNDKDLLDLITSCLSFNPKKRLTPTQAIEHPFFKNSKIAHLLQNLVVYKSQIPLHTILREEVRLSSVQYRKELYRLILEKKADRIEQLKDLKVPSYGKLKQSHG